MPDTISGPYRQGSGGASADMVAGQISVRQARERGERRERIAETDPRKVRQKYLKTSTKPRFTPKKMKRISKEELARRLACAVCNIPLIIPLLHPQNSLSESLKRIKKRAHMYDFK